MRIHLVAERELRAAARRKSTYWVRWLTAVGFFLLLVWMMWALDALTRSGGVHNVFSAYSVVVFFYCMLVGAIRTADCISSERREGTLGLLFLTNLNSAEIVAGKLFSNALSTVYGLLAIFPMLALPLLMGGVTLGEFLRTLLALVSAIFFSLGCGMTASVLCRRQFPAVALAMGMVLALGTGSFLGAAILEEVRRGHWLVGALASASPLYMVCAAQEGTIFRSNHFWLAVTQVSAFALLLLGLSTLLLSVSWRDRVKSSRRSAPSKASASPREATPPATRRHRFRRQLLSLNPFYWLAARHQIGAPVFLVVSASVVFLSVASLTPLFARINSPGRLAHAVGEMLAWLCAAALLHVITLYYTGMLGAQSFAEDKQSGALEQIFSTPVRVDTILRGTGMAFRRRMRLPMLMVCAVHACAVWKIMGLAVLDPPGRVNLQGVSQWHMLWASLLNTPLNGRHLEWGFVLGMRIVALILPLAFVLWFTLAQVGRWLGLRMKHPGFAPLLALALLVAPSILGISLSTYAIANLFDDYNEEILIPVLTTVAFAIVLSVSAVLRDWASINLKHRFRQTVLGRLDPPPSQLSPMARSLALLPAKAAAVGLMLFLLVVAHYQWQNYRSLRDWNAFQSRLKQQHESLELSSVLPRPVPDAENFAKAACYVSLAAGGNSPLESLIGQMPHPDWTLNGWKAQERLSLVRFTEVIGMAKPSGSPQPPTYPSYAYPPYMNSRMPEVPRGFSGPTNNLQLAPLLLKHLEPSQKELAELADAALLPSFQPATNSGAVELLQATDRDLTVLRKLHLVYTLRALAELHTNGTDAAASDVLTGLRLARLAGQVIHTDASGDAQCMMLSSLQPVWEGLAGHQWSDAQLSAFQNELARLDPAADFIHSIEWVLRATIAHWSTLPDLPESQWRIPEPTGYSTRRNWRGVHRRWWYDRSIQLYLTTKDAVAAVTPSGTNGSVELYWGSFYELPMSGQCQQLFQRAASYYGSDNPLGVQFGQTSLHQARAAIALEQYWSSGHGYPTNLDQLVPTYLPAVPLDPQVWQPLLYELKSDGSFLLRGVGVNRTNNSGSPGSDDWIWTYSTNSPAQAIGSGRQ